MREEPYDKQMEVCVFILSPFPRQQKLPRAHKTA
jgi:hypothetical protein